MGESIISGKSVVRWKRNEMLEGITKTGEICFLILQPSNLVERSSKEMHLKHNSDCEKDVTIKEKLFC